MTRNFRLITARKPKTSIYTLLLIIALVALLTGCLFLWLEIKRFGGFGTVRGTVQAITAPADTQFAQQYVATSRIA